MPNHTLSVLILLIYSNLLVAWQTGRDEESSDMVKPVYLRKRHMLPSEHRIHRRMFPSTQRTRENRKKASGHHKSLEEDEVDEEPEVHVPIGPPPLKFKREFIRKSAQKDNTTNIPPSAVTLVSNVLNQLAKDFLSRQVNEDFVFGQYVGNAMRNLTSELRLKMQHDILDLIVKYQKLNRGESIHVVIDKNIHKLETKINEKKANETDDKWTDFTNLDNIMI